MNSQDGSSLTEEPVVEASVVDPTHKEMNADAVEEAANKNETGHAANGRVSKNNKISRDKVNAKGITPAAPPRKPVLSQSLSFPSRGPRANGMKKSVDGVPMKSDSKHVRPNDSSGSVTSAASTTNKQAPCDVETKASKSNGNKAPGTQTATSFRHSLPGQKPVSGNAPTDIPPIELSSSHDQILKPAIAARAVDEVDDARSTTSSTTSRGRKNGAAGFAFRLDERAERRKEFFSKLEEKIQAKEAEKTNLQAKSKETQDAEIKKLRKSMTFRAAPMPNFYKEPPPKAELKKIPTTRPVSPKLGRNKSFAATSTARNFSEGAASPRLNREEGKSPKSLHAKHDKETVSTKKAVRRTQSRLQSQESSNSEPVKTAAPLAGLDGQSNKEVADGSEQPLSNGELEAIAGQSSPQMNPIHNDEVEPMFASAASEIMPQEVAVGG